MALAALARAAGLLKRVRRKGWVDRGVVDGESVADHSYRVAVMAWAAARAGGLDADRAMRLGLLHDLAEADIGDETPFDDALAREGFDPAQFDRPAPRDAARAAAKHARERAAIVALAAELPHPIARELLAAADEYAAQSTPEARLVKAIDRLETMLQADDYLAEQPALRVGSFRHGVDRALAELFQRG